MAEPQAIEERFRQVPISALLTGLSALRLRSPRAEARMEESLRRYGQLTALVVSEGLEGYELVDGFKRYYALIRLGVTSVRVRVFPGSMSALKAAMVHVNWRVSTITALEEGLIVESLIREEGLSQVQVGVLLGRHKSWVCRRLSLVERLDPEIVEQIRLGLIRPSVARALALLPRGNQPQALAAVQKHRLDSRETERLVRMLLERPRYEHGLLLSLPLEILDNRVAPRPRGAPQTVGWHLDRMEASTRRLSSLVPSHVLCPSERQRLKTLSVNLSALVHRLEPVRENF